MAAVVTPLVSVLTATWLRHDLLLGRCMPSVQAQEYPLIEHVIVSDGPDDELAAKLRQAPVPRHALAWSFLAQHSPERHWGTYCRAAALDIAQGELIAYVDDDDSLRPEHVRVLADAMIADPELGFVYSRMISHQPSGEKTIGDCMPPIYGQIGTMMLMHRRSVLDVAAWDTPAPDEDWGLVAAWIDAGVKYTRVDRDTSDTWPSVYQGLENVL